MEPSSDSSKKNNVIHLKGLEFEHTIITPIYIIKNIIKTKKKKSLDAN